MKKNKLFIILALICIFQLAVPLSIMGLREIAEDSGLQGKLKIEAAWYYEETDILDLTFDKELWRNVYSSNGYAPVYLDENGYVVSSGNTKLKPSSPYLSRDKVNSRYEDFEKERIKLLVSEKELHDILFKVICDKPYREIDMYVTVSIFEGEPILKDFRVDGTKLVEFNY